MIAIMGLVLQFGITGSACGFLSCVILVIRWGIDEVADVGFEVSALQEEDYVFRLPESRVPAAGRSKLPTV